MNSVNLGKNLRANIMEKQWIKFFQLWSETEEYQRRILEAQKVIRKALNQYNSPYLSYSGGKDSTVMLYMVLQQKPDLTVWHWDYGNSLMPREIEKEVLENAKKIGAINIIINKRENHETARTDHATGYKKTIIHVLVQYNQ
jgi:3'-phosphoadenosine 5'-phosphosulfate sulfotransferase (PAPS reductase)/FAD synthetase